jgi:5-methyltetrahydropteroyltriglutamate--homocysteine methyltransferase
MTLIPTSLVGSYVQPEWLINREMLAKQMPPRVRVEDLWRVAPKWLELAHATALSGLDLDNPGKIVSRSGHEVLVPRVTGEIRRMHPVQIRDIQFLRANTSRKTKITVPGPFTMAQQAVNEFYPNEEALAMAYAGALNDEIRDLFAAGADVVQIDEPYMQAYPDKARAYGVPVLNRALEGITGDTAVHICFGYGALVAGRPAGYSFLTELGGSIARQISIETAQSKLDCSVLSTLTSQKIILGVLDLSTHEVEDAATVAGRIRKALPYVPAERLIAAPDCGLKYLPRDVAFGKMKSLAEGAAMVRAEIEKSAARA